MGTRSVCGFFLTWVGSYENHCFEINAHTFIFQIGYPTLFFDHLFFSIFRPHGSACAMFRVKRVQLAFTEYVRQINIYIYKYYMKNPPFDSVVWGSQLGLSTFWLLPLPLGMTPQHFHTIPTSCAILPTLAQI